MSYRVFISHSMNKADREVLDELASKAKSVGIDCYLAEVDNQAGESLPEKLHKAIKSCHAFVVFLTTHGVSSHYVNQEIGVAYECGKPVIPIVEKGVRAEGFLVDKECIPFDRSNPQRVAEPLMESLVALKSKSDFWETMALAGLLIGAAYLLSKGK